jgi:Na+-driven multidrug efflux pump
MILNLGAFGYGPLINIFIQLIQAPLFIIFWGVDRYGEWIVLTGIPMTLSLLDLGVSHASANKSALEAGEGRWDKVRNTLQTARLYSIVIGLIVVFLAVILSLFIDWTSVLKLNLITRSSASIVLITLSLSLAIQLQSGYLDAWMRCYSKEGLSVLIMGNSKIIEIIITSVFLSVGGGVIFVAFGCLLSSLIIRATHLIVSRKNAPHNLNKFGRTSWKQFKSIIKPSLGYIGFPLTQILTIQGGVQVLNQLASSEILVAFTMTRTLTRLLMQIGVVCNSSLKPLLSRLIGSNQYNKATEVTRDTSLYASLIAAIGYGILILTGPLILKIWSRGHVDVSREVIAAVGLHAFVNILWFIPIALIIAENKHTKYAFIYSISSIASISIWILYKKLINPIYGASFVLLAPEIIMAATLFIYYCEVRKTNNKYFL